MLHFPLDIDARLARLESSIRRDRTIVFGVIAIFFVTAQAPQPTVGPQANAPIVLRDSSGSTTTLSARGLTIRDRAGKERLFVGVDSAGRPSVDLSDSSGGLRESMYLLNDFPILRQFDAAGKRRAEIRLDSNNDGEFLLTDKAEKLRLGLFRRENGDPEFALYGSDEKVRAYFATDDVSPYLVMKDGSGTTRVVVGGYQSGAIGMDIRNSSNVTLWSKP